MDYCPHFYKRVPTYYDVHGEIRQRCLNHVRRYANFVYISIPFVFIQDKCALGTGIDVYGWWNAQSDNPESQAQFSIDGGFLGSVTTNTSDFVFKRGLDTQGPSALLYSAQNLDPGTHTLSMANDGAILGLDGFRIMTSTATVPSTSSSAFPTGQSTTAVTSASSATTVAPSSVSTLASAATSTTAGSSGPTSGRSTAHESVSVSGTCRALAMF